MLMLDSGTMVVAVKMAGAGTPAAESGTEMLSLLREVMKSHSMVQVTHLFHLLRLQLPKTSRQSTRVPIKIAMQVAAKLDGVASSEEVAKQVRKAAVTSHPQGLYVMTKMIPTISLHMSEMETGVLEMR